MVIAEWKEGLVMKSVIIPIPHRRSIPHRHAVDRPDGPRNHAVARIAIVAALVTAGFVFSAARATAEPSTPVEIALPN